MNQQLARRSCFDDGPSHPAFTTSKLVSKTRCSVLPALDINGYLPRTTLVVEGAVTQEIFEHWLETAVLPQCEPFPGKRSVVVMDNCSTHHLKRIIDICSQAGVYLLYLPPYSPHLNPIEQSFHLLKQWLKRWRDLAPRPEEYEGLEGNGYKLA
ncbi:hypothetical protein E4T38_03392 [Aureobasidium subglaciale]|nr:hypothetical protein E4T38_03392 [Aureobasidium subglaciale]KAI5226116.1 hypothetical protein E4T40_03230 [Aureobasidium subglaciale]KAI5229461.1 hypothetical protein E4T41_03389 [Aureobasidium subglaciale]KAI5264129.1 hypothetical protein E4T46_03167 [Aureobasidium subglaciale]